jgi:CO/xanthine dehydrogenase Mo-binding subunit
MPVACSRRQLLEGAGLMIAVVSLSSDEAAATLSRRVEISPLLDAPDPESVDSWLAISRDGSVTVFTGRVDLGTGTETIYAQFVAEELDVPLKSIRVIMGDTRYTPDQGKTTASLNAVRGSQPLRVAAAEARAMLIRLASEKLGVAASELEAVEGAVRQRSLPGKSVSYGELIGNRRFGIRLQVTGKTTEDLSRGVMLKQRTPPKAFKDYKIVGQPVRRIDLPAKAACTFEYIHNMRVLGMLHGRTVRPPARGAKLLSVDGSALADIPGAKVVRRNDFLAVAAPREEDAIRAASLLKAAWSGAETLPQFDNFYEALLERPVVGSAFSYNSGDIEAGLAKGQTRHKARYDFPFHLHGMIGPSCAIADVKDGGCTVWSGTQWPQGDCRDLAEMLGLPVERVHVIWKEASGSYGRLASDDAAADAAVMSQALKRPVRVQWTRQEEHIWEPLSPAMVMTIEGAADADGRITAFDYVQYSPSHSTGEKGNFLAWHLVGGAPSWGRLSGAATNPGYAIAAKRGRNVYVEPWLRHVYLRGPGGLQSNFAYESFMDELAAMGGFDPLEIRLKNSADPRDIELLQTVAQLSGWERRVRGPRDRASAVLTGRGLALAHYGPGDTRSAAVIDIELERSSGKIRVTKAAIAVDCGLVINPDGLRNQIEGGLIQGISRALHEEVRFDRKNITTSDWIDYPIIAFSEIPDVKVEIMSRPGLAWSCAGEAGTIPTAGALANAVFDAAGKHPRRLPVNPAFVSSLLQVA